ncbi:ArsR/SmtB family transcription factor [Dictyobacter kobayashii]|uniref:HTH arsR-type domain-containing protein n=1 Tax=Dictyobacter kobayashii TaxID=2014872 RepID=A0A402ATH6_9CHLR|nr:winged helix-turn-helix domain-containing protein [Dictyobacter kobayashii]GCE22401.1 hypothetical protein KDK_62010 [Dictyobacter kobayashii]
MSSEQDKYADTTLVDGEAIVMPELPATLTVNSAQQFKAFGDTTRMSILDLIKYEPLTAKQIGARLKIPAGTIGHHLQVLEAAGLAQVVARRLVHGITAKYYTRTARLFIFDFPPEVASGMERTLNFLTQARAQLVDTLAADAQDVFCHTGFPHARLSRERVEEFNRRLFELAYDFATAEPDPDGQVYGLSIALFQSPPYLQNLKPGEEQQDIDIPD